MGKSRKKTPVSTICCCKSQKQGKQACHRGFRRKERMMVLMGRYESLPNQQYEIMNPWDLGGDGKTYWGHFPDSKWYVKLMRK